MPSPWPQTDPSPAQRAAYADAQPVSFWLDSLPDRSSHEPLTGRTEADLCIIGGGYTGLWAALAAKAADPGRDVILLEATRCGNGASGRNGGFLEASLTHGLANGLSRFPEEIDQLEALAAENFAGLRADLATHDIECDYVTPGVLTVALEPRELEDLQEEVELTRRFGHDVELLDAERVRVEVNSPTYLGAVWDRTGSALVHPGRLAEGLRAAAHRQGVRIHELTPVRTLRAEGAATVTVSAEGGVVTARRVLMATSAYPPLIPAVKRYIAPVYDYALMTEPLSEAQRDAIGWSRRQGISDMGNQFHYYRPTADGRILFGGYDAVYRHGGDVGPHRDDDDADLRHALPALLHHVSAAGGAEVQPSLGRGHRHLQPLLGVLWPGVRRPPRVRAGLHRAGRGGQPLRGAHRPGPARWPRHTGDPTQDGAPAPGAVPTRAAALRRHPAHAQPPGRRRPSRRPARSVAAHA